MHIASWRALPVLIVLVVAAALFWAMVQVFGSEPAGGPEASLAAQQSNLPRVELGFPDVSGPLVDPLAEPFPELSPSPSPASDAGRTNRTTTATTTTRPKAPYIPSNGSDGSEAQGEDGDPQIGPDSFSGGDATDPVGDLDGLEDPDTFGPATPTQPAPPQPEPEEEEEEVDNRLAGLARSGNALLNGISSGSSGSNGADGASETATDQADSEEGEVG